MAIYKNVSGQKIAVYAHDTAADGPKTGDQANITAQISLDGGTTAATNDVNPTQLDATDAPGIYIFDMTQAETNADLVILSAVSSTSDISIEPVLIYTMPTWANTQVAQTGDTYTRLGAPTGASIAADVLSAIAGYYGFVWLDTSKSNTNTTAGVDGTMRNPVSTIAAAITLCTALNIKRIHVASGSSVTLGATMSNYELIGNDWTLLLGTRDISNSHFEGATSVTGTGTGTNPSFHHCDFGNATLPPCTVWESCLSGTITLGTVGSLSVWKFMACHAGGSTLSAIIDMNGQEAAVAVADWSGTLTLDNSTHNNGTFSLYGTGAFIENASCTSALATLEVAGNVRFTKNGSNISTDTSRWGEDQNIATANALGTQAKADVNNEVLDVFAVDEHVEIGQSAWPSTTTFKQIFQSLYKALRNKKTQTSSEYKLFNDDGTTVGQKSVISDDGSTTTIGEIEIGS